MAADDHPIDLLFIAWSYSKGGGAEKVLSHLINGLHRTGRFRISLLEVSHEDVAWPPLPDDVAVLPPVLDETRSDPLYRVRRHRRRRLLDSQPEKVRDEVRDGHRFDLVVAFNYLYPTFLAYDDEPLISWNHGTINDLEDRPEACEIQRKAYDRAAAIVAIAERTRQSIADLYPECAPKLRVIHNGFPFEEIRSKAAQAPSLTLSHPAVLAVGRLDENKNPLGIVRGFAGINEMEPEAQLYFIGQGALEQRARQLADELGIADCVHFLGYHCNPYPLIKQADCLLSLSRVEGFQTVIVEALSLGVPFVSSDAGAARELSGQGRFGAVVSAPDQVPSAYRRVAEAADDPRWRRETARFVEQFSVENQVEAFCRLADEVLGERSA